MDEDTDDAQATKKVSVASGAAVQLESDAVAAYIRVTLEASSAPASGEAKVVFQSDQYGD